MAEIHFDEYGLIPEFPEEIIDAQVKYWNIIKPYLDKMTMTEARAFLFYINFDADMSAYIIRRRVGKRKPIK